MLVTNDYSVTDTSVSILPIEEILNYDSCDSDGVWVEGTGTVSYSVWTILAEKREDPWYPALVEKIRAEGFTGGIRIHPDGNEVRDGHHRIAAAIDLGYSFVPVETGRYAQYDEPWEWGAEEYGYDS